MKGDDRSFDELRAAVLRFRDAREWKPFHKPKDLAISISLEAAELLEHFQWRDEAEVKAYLAKKRKHTEVADELADIQCLLLSMADAVDVDLHAATLRKLKKAARKYPVSKSKGTARKYRDL